MGWTGGFYCICGQYLNVRDAFHCQKLYKCPIHTTKEELDKWLAQFVPKIRTKKLKAVEDRHQWIDEAYKRSTRKSKQEDAELFKGICAIFAAFAVFFTCMALRVHEYIL